MRRLVLPLSILSWLGVWAALKFGVQPPIPGQVMGLYMAITTVAILVFLVADQDRFQAFLSPLIALLREQRLGVPRARGRHSDGGSVVDQAVSLHDGESHRHAFCPATTVTDPHA